jgi:hypothetical protein
MSPTELNKYKMAACEPKRKSRMLNKQKEMENAGSSSIETAGSFSTPTETNNKSPSNYQPFKRPQSLGKAIKRSIRSLPQSPRKREAVVSGLAKRFGVDMEKEMEAYHCQQQVGTMVLQKKYKMQSVPSISAPIYHTPCQDSMIK